MSRGIFAFRMVVAALATVMVLCAPAVGVSAKGGSDSLAALWESPPDLAQRNLYYGPWGAANAPDPDAVYTLVQPKKHGTRSDIVVMDPAGRTWSVMQPGERAAEGPTEVVLSRVLSAIGYHQPPVYFLPSFTITDASGVQRVEPGGRFRLEHPSLEERDEWSWRTNPFVGTRPYQGLLVILLMFANTDLQTSNNTIYEMSRDGRTEEWYVVRDLGAALGERKLLKPMPNDPELFEQQDFITGVAGGFVTFGHGIQQRTLFDGRITPEDATWAIDLLASLSERQWRDAFRAGGYEPDVASRFIAKLRSCITEGREVAHKGGVGQARSGSAVD